MQYLNFYLLPLLTARDFIDFAKLFKFNSLSSFKFDLLFHLYLIQKVYAWNGSN